MWPADKLPDFTLAPDSSARGKGLDLAKPFTLDGNTHDPLLGMNPATSAGPRATAARCSLVNDDLTRFPVLRPAIPQ